ncbi:hypothetical protein ACIQU6_34895 [Streptomyces sp. NPDC090442]|uniref:hypothetical protein n=1 Tax=Streptomyces sp. NPDC090442 TaxID=3365962 RepID=UPI00382DE04F
MLAVRSALGRFPLVRRFRPPCPPLPERIAELHHLSELATQQGDIRKGSAVYNLAALIAVDSGLPHLARELCWQHANLYLQHQPLPGQWACFALEPLVNLAQIHNRLGHGERAFQLLTNLHRATTSASDTTLDGTPLSVAALARTLQDQRQLREWANGVYRQDGARALVAADQWSAANAHLQQGNCTSSRMFEARQIAVIALITSGETAQALTMLRATEPGEPWEQAVTACLEALCDAWSVTPALDIYQRLELAKEHVVFHTRLGLALIDTATRADHGFPEHHATTLIEHVLNAGDGYAARDLLNHPACSEFLDAHRLQKLCVTVAACALSQGQSAEQLRERLATALAASAAVIHRTLS